MSDLSIIEKGNLERLLGMESGYVLDFSKRTFDELVFDSTGKSIYDSKYDNGSGSKANRLRAFWSSEPNYVVSKLLEDRLPYHLPGPEEKIPNNQSLTPASFFHDIVERISSMHPREEEKSGPADPGEVLN